MQRRVVHGLLIGTLLIAGLAATPVPAPEVPVGAHAPDDTYLEDSRERGSPPHMHLPSGVQSGNRVGGTHERSLPCILPQTVAQAEDCDRAAGVIRRNMRQDSAPSSLKKPDRPPFRLREAPVDGRGHEASETQD